MRAGCMRRRAYLCAIGLPAAMFGCSGESTFVVEPVDAGAPGAQHGSACSAWAATVCAYEARCPPDFPWVSETQCLARSALWCESVASDPDVVFDDLLLTSCQYPNACLSSVAYLPVDCLAPGRTPVGGTCVFDEACQSKTCSDLCGTCLPAACDGGCSVDAGYPDSGDDDAIGQPPRAPGESCLEGTDCQSLQCDASGHCAETVTAVGYGQPCDESSVTQICGGDATCYGVCIPPENDGDPCDVSQGLDCLQPAVCAGDFCVFPSRTMCGGQGAVP
jgi:hypothetical protein